MNKVLFSLLLLGGLSAQAATQCPIAVPEETSQEILTTLHNKGYTVVDQGSAQYALRFEEYEARAIAGKDGHANLAGSLALKIYKLGATRNGKDALQITIRVKSSVEGQNATVVEAAENLYSNLVNHKSLAVKIPSCRQLN